MDAVKQQFVVHYVANRPLGLLGHHRLPPKRISLEIAAISPADFRSWALNIFLILYPSNHIVERPLAPLWIFRSGSAGMR